MLGGILHPAIERERDRRRRLGWNLVEHIDISAVLVDADHPPPGLAVEFVDHRLAHLADDGGCERGVGRQQIGLRGHQDTGQPVEPRSDTIMVRGAQGDQLQRAIGGTGLLGQPLRVEGVVEGAQHVGDDAGGRHQVGAGFRSVELIAEQVARYQHLGSALLVDRGPPRWVGPQFEALVLPQPGMQSTGDPANPPCALIADQVQHTVIGPGAFLGKLPGEAIIHAAGVLGIARTQDLGIQMGGLQARPGFVQGGMRLGRQVAELGCRPGITASEGGEELLSSRRGTIRARGASRQRCGRQQCHRRRQSCDSCD